ncbi:MAG: helix-turn-helix domain-containing protein [Clostridia bacterium]|nr:helix-turn-helix domain-containing protein [Clostridia bacterium]
MSSIHGKRAALSLEKPEELQMIAKALSSPLRLEIMRALWTKSMNVGELAEQLNQPMSTTALAVKVLEDAGIIKTEVQPSVRGTMKLCTRKLDYIAMDLTPHEEQQQSTSITLSMPIGGYSIAERIQPTCGLASRNAYIGEMDTVSCFYHPERFQAQLIWFQAGMLEYRFSCINMDNLDYNWLELSFEACSEAPMYRNPWKSDIAVAVNGHRLGIWTCPCDCGGRHGVVTPAWWSDTSTQFGFLKTWRVDDSGTYLDNERISKLNIRELDIDPGKFISVQIGIPEDAENQGGMNLFGEGFGDYAQPLVLRLGYQIRP